MISDIQNLNKQLENGLVFPNPAKNHFTLQLHSPLAKPAMIEVINLYGQVMAQQLLPPGQAQLEFSTADWPAGGYLLKVHPPGSTFIMKRIVVMK
jgi:hypothetical protein